MGRLLMAIGYAWMLFGVVSCWEASQAQQSDTQLGVTTILTMLLFVVPGGILGAIGQRVSRREHR